MLESIEGIDDTTRAPLEIVTRLCGQRINWEWPVQQSAQICICSVVHATVGFKQLSTCTSHDDHKALWCHHEADSFAPCCLAW